MLRARILVTLVLTGLFAAAITVGMTIAANSPAAYFTGLMTEECPAPCFMGIRPGITGEDEAISLLRENPRVDQVSPEGQKVWMWSGDWSFVEPRYVQGRLHITDGIVTQISVETLLPFSEVWRMFGRPDKGTVQPRRMVASNRQVRHFATYPDAGIWLYSDSPCPVQPATFWNARTILIIGGQPEVQLEDYDLSAWLQHPVGC